MWEGVLVVVVGVGDWVVVVVLLVVVVVLGDWVVVVVVVVVVEGVGTGVCCSESFLLI